MTDLSILIPSRNEIFLARTIQDITANMRGDTEIIAVLDGQWAEPPISDHPRVTLVYHPESIGQRAATNEAARISSAKYVLKCDAHCAFAEGFDIALMADMQDNWTVSPLMKNLHAFDWICNVCGERTYQGPKRCGKCGSENVIMDVVWIAKRRPNSTAYRFDKTMHFQYWGDYARRPEAQGELSETMSLQGSCWMMTREQYHRLNICDEEFGSWGQQGVEVAVKTWLSGGQVMVNKRTWYAHMFRTQNGFSFPYPLSGSQIEHARERSRNLFLGDNWPLAVRPFAWLLDHFAPIPEWHDRPVNQRRGIIYYTCNTHKPDIERACRVQLRQAAGDIEIGCVSLQPTEYGDWQITMPLRRSPVSMHRQILAGLERSQADVIFLCESDVLYHPSHFDFIPPRRDVFYYNTNVWRVRYDDGLAVWTDDLQQVSGLCAYRELLLDFYAKRLAQIEQDGFNNHYEPGVKQTIYPRMRGGVYGTENRQSAAPNICIRHDKNLTKSKWSPEEFRNLRYAKGWRETEEIPGWGKFTAIMQALS